MEMAQQQKQNSHQVKSGNRHTQDIRLHFSGFDSRMLATLARVKNKIAQVRPLQN